jgi:hypothetical protein
LLALILRAARRARALPRDSRTTCRGGVSGRPFESGSRRSCLDRFAREEGCAPPTYTTAAVRCLRSRVRCESVLAPARAPRPLDRARLPPRDSEKQPRNLTHSSRNVGPFSTRTPLRARYSSGHSGGPSATVARRELRYRPEGQDAVAGRCGGRP